MTRENDEYTVDEAARLLGLSPARVRQMLRSGELEGERREERVEGVLGPWRIPAGGVRALRERLYAEAAEIQEVALREELRREKERSEALRAELEEERRARGRDEPRGAWRRLLGG